MLANLYQATKKDGGNDDPWDETFGYSIAVTLEILKPQYTAEAEVHEEVQYFVDICHLIEWRLWRIEKREEKDYTEN